MSIVALMGAIGAGREAHVEYFLRSSDYLACLRQREPPKGYNQSQNSHQIADLPDSVYFAVARASGASIKPLDKAETIS